MRVAEEEAMSRIRISYVIAVLLVWCINGYAFLQHLAVLPEINGFIAAALLVNMATAPLVMWGAYVFGQIAEERLLRRKHRRATMVP